MTSIGDLRRLGETPSMEQILDTLELLEKRDIAVEDLPMKKLQDNLELNWQPEGKILLQNKSVTLDNMAPLGTPVSLSLSSGWANVANHPPLRACLIAPSLVLVQGTLNGNAATSVLAATVPTGMRPVIGQTLFPVTYYTGAAISYGVWQVLSGGNVNVYGATSGLVAAPEYYIFGTYRTDI